MNHLSRYVKLKDFVNVNVREDDTITKHHLMGTNPKVLYLDIEPYDREITDAYHKKLTGLIHRNRKKILGSFDDKNIIVVDDVLVIKESIMNEAIKLNKAEKEYLKKTYFHDRFRGKKGVYPQHGEDIEKHPDMAKIVKRNQKYWAMEYPTLYKFLDRDEFEKKGFVKFPKGVEEKFKSLVKEGKDNPEVHTVTYDLSKKSDKDLIKDIGKYNNVEGKKVTFRDGTHTRNFVYKKGKWVNEQIKENNTMKLTVKELKEMIVEVIKEETAYQAFFKKKLGGRNLGDMSDEEKKSFFADVDKEWKGKNEVKETLKPVSPAEGNPLKRVKAKKRDQILAAENYIRKLVREELEFVMFNQIPGGLSRKRAKKRILQKGSAQTNSTV